MWQCVIILILFTYIVIQKIRNRTFFIKDTIISFKKNFNKSDLPIIPIDINGTLYNFIIDTGAAINGISINTVENNPTDFPKPINSNNTITGAGSDTISNNVAKLIKVDLTIKSGNEIYFYDDIELNLLELGGVLSAIYQSSGIIVHGIIGNTFIKNNEWIIDYQKLSIRT